MADKLCFVKNRSAGTVSYRIPEDGIRRLFQPGEIKFKIVNKEIPTGKTWSGILNIFKFKFNQNYSGNSSVKIY